MGDRAARQGPAESAGRSPSARLNELLAGTEPRIEVERAELLIGDADTLEAADGRAKAERLPVGNDLDGVVNRISASPSRQFLAAPGTSLFI